MCLLFGHDCYSAHLLICSSGIFSDWFNDASPEIVAACKSQVEILKSRGATVKEITIPNLRTIGLAHNIVITTEAVNNLESVFAKVSHRPVWSFLSASILLRLQHRKDLQAETRIVMTLARAFTGRDYLAANQVRHYAYDIVKEIFESDVATTTRLMRFA